MNWCDIIFVEVIELKIELSDFVIESDKDVDYINDVISTLESGTSDILNFFELEKLSKKKLVRVFTDREKYKEHMLKFVPIFKEWMCADVYDGNINLLDIAEARKSEEHKDMDLDEFEKCILHEFVHACQQEIYSNSGGNSWYWEALATNLSGQHYNLRDLSNCDFNSLQKDFYNTKYNYSYSFTLGNFMIKNYSKNELLEYIRNPGLLKDNANNIFELAKKAQLEEKATIHEIK